MALAHSSVIVTGAAVDNRARDQLSLTYTPRPQEMSVYVRFLNLTEGSSVNTRIWQIGASTAPRFLVYLGTSNLYHVLYQNATAAARDQAMGAAVAYGDRVELLATLTAGGVVQLHQSLNGGAITSSTAGVAAVMPVAWSQQILWINSISTASVGLNAFRNLEMVSGVRTMQQMRVLAGTD